VCQLVLVICLGFLRKLFKFNFEPWDVGFGPKLGLALFDFPNGYEERGDKLSEVMRGT